MEKEAFKKRALDTTTLQFEGEVWKRCKPPYDLYEVSNYARVRPCGKARIRLVKQVDRVIPTGGAYKKVWLRRSDGEYAGTIDVHRLVAQCFVDNPDATMKIQVNHKDGDKSYHAPCNLEWVTPKENVRHAFDAGLIGYSVKVDMCCAETGEVLKRFNTMTALTEYLGVQFTEGNTIVRKSLKKPYLGKYVFKKDMDARTVKKTSRVKAIVGRDYVNNVIINATDQTEMEHLSGIERSAVGRCCIRGGRHLIGGWHFRYMDDDFEWPEITEKEALKSKKALENRKEVERTIPVSYWDYEKDVEVKCASVIDASTKSGVHEIRIYRYIDVPEFRVFQGKVFKRSDDTRPYPHIPKEAIPATWRTKRAEFPPIVVEDLETGDVTYHASLPEVASYIGSTTGSLTGAFKRCRERGKPFKRRWRLDWLKLA